MLSMVPGVPDALPAARIFSKVLLMASATTGSLGLPG